MPQHNRRRPMQQVIAVPAALVTCTAVLAIQTPAQAIIDTLGDVESGLLRVVSSNDHGFDRIKR